MAQRAATRDEVCGPLGTPGGVAPALNAATDPQVDLALETAALTVWPSRWRKLTSKAHAYLAAHILATTPGLGLGEGGEELPIEAGPLVSAADGPASASWGTTGSTEAGPAGDAWLATTPYGNHFLHLRRAQRGYGSIMVGTNTVRFPV